MRLWHQAEKWQICLCAAQGGQQPGTVSGIAQQLWSVVNSFADRAVDLAMDFAPSTFSRAAVGWLVAWHSPCSRAVVFIAKLTAAGLAAHLDARFCAMFKYLCMLIQAETVVKAGLALGAIILVRGILGVSICLQLAVTFSFFCSACQSPICLICIGPRCRCIADVLTR